MHHSKLITILKSLDPTEFRQFYRYLQAPLLTQSKDVLNLYNVVRKHYPTFDSPKLDRQKVFKKLYPKKAFDGNRFSILLFKLTKILDEYLIFLKFQQDEFEKKKLLTQIYGERNLNVIFKKNTQELLEELERQPYRDSQYFYDSYFLQQDYYFHTSTSKQGNIVETLKNAIQRLDNFHVLERLVLGIDLKNREHIFAECHEFNPNAAVIELKDNLVYLLLKKGNCLLESKEEKIYSELKSLLLTNVHLVPNKEGAIVLLLLINYAIRQSSKDETKFRKELLELYKVGIESKLLFVNGKISDNTFLNIVMVGSKSKKIAFTKEFILENTQFLNDSTRADTKTLALSALYFNQENYTEVIKTLQSFNFTYALNKITGRLYLIRTYYHLFEEDDSFHSLLLANCESFARFAKREPKIGVQKRTATINFIFLLKKIINAKTNTLSNNQVKGELLQILDNFTSVLAIGWLKLVINKL